MIQAATVGPDGRVQDTPEVAAAKAAHAAAQFNERINLANEAARSGGTIVTAAPAVAVPLVASNAVVVPAAPIGPDGRVQDTQEVAVAKAAHANAHLNEKLNLANEAAKSADVLAVAGPALAYGRLVYWLNRYRFWHVHRLLLELLTLGVGNHEILSFEKAREAFIIIHIK